MANTTTKLTPDVHGILVKAFERGMSKVSACKLAGIHHNTLRLWLINGASKKSGKYRELYDAVEDARSTFWEAKQTELEQVVYKQATQGTTTFSVKYSRVMKLSAEEVMLIQEVTEQSEELNERFNREGILYKQELTIRQHRPDGDLALEILARRAPEEWGKYETLKLEMDLRKELEELGIKNPEALIEGVVATMEQLVEVKGEAPLAISGETQEK